MTPCARCGQLLRPGLPGPCPHCSERSAPATDRRLTAAALLLGLGLAACDGTTTSPQPAYGVTVTDTGDTGDTEQ
ncbi:MAG: hypothetical protein H6738_17705 [Alphaproteobacteria bacterium]|nr:hypothetical protein [Alphaproteobacteria bacterium]MCB9698621.1 hypothetical protein [Alphaproteobacteria bacterium]